MKGLCRVHTGFTQDLYRVYLGFRLHRVEQGLGAVGLIDYTVCSAGLRVQGAGCRQSKDKDTSQKLEDLGLTVLQGPKF